MLYITVSNPAIGLFLKLAYFKKQIYRTATSAENFSKFHQILMQAMSFVDMTDITMHMFALKMLKKNNQIV